MKNRGKMIQRLTSKTPRVSNKFTVGSGNNTSRCLKALITTNLEAEGSFISTTCTTNTFTLYPIIPIFSRMEYDTLGLT